MFELGWGFLLLAIAASILARMADHRYRQIPQLTPERPSESLPALSIIIPARDEAVNLRRLLPTLNNLEYPGPLEIIVIDDDFSDGTSEVALEFGAVPRRLSTLPPDWLGKPYAAHQGAAHADGDWLLFTDADTTHHPLGPATAVAYALERKIDGLSLFIKQETRGIGDGLPLLTALAGLFLGIRSGTPVLNGQFIFIRRQVYEVSGGFAAVRMEPLEDLALGKHLNQLGYDVPILQGDVMAQVHMYSNFRQLWQGLIRLGSGALHWTGRRSLLVAIFITLVMMPLIGVLAAVGGLLDVRLAAGVWLIVAFGMVPWAGRVSNPWHAFFAPLGALIVQAAATWGLLIGLLGHGFLWKDRVILARGQSERNRKRNRSTRGAQGLK